jgi:hypothetical protein
MNRLTRCFIAPLLCLGVMTAEAKAAGAPEHPNSPAPVGIRADVRSLTTPIQFKHGDISWLPELARQAGWRDGQIKRLGQIILRESGGCPYRRGGDIVDSSCNVTGVSEWNHRSDSGLLQINGVHWKRDHAQYAGLVCKQMKVCEQDKLLDPLTNLKAGRLLFEVAGWSPWFTN